MSLARRANGGERGVHASVRLAPLRCGRGHRYDRCALAAPWAEWNRALRCGYGTRTDARHREVHGVLAVVVARARRAEGDLVAVAKPLFTTHALAIDEGAIQASQIAKDERFAALLDEAMLFRNDFVEELNGVVRMATETVDRPKLDRLLSLCCRED